jgi:hypothetical protein
MRRVLVILVLAACSKGESKGAPGADQKGGAEAGGGAPGTKELKVDGTLTFGGALTTEVSWKPDLALTCTCINDKDWAVDATMSDGKDTFVAVSVNTMKGITVTSGKLPSPSPMLSEGRAGISGACKPDKRNTDGVISVDLDAKLSGKDGEVTMKGHLDVVCREGL